MGVLPRSVEKVIEAFERLPGVGPKSAARMTYFLLRAPKERSAALAEALIKMKDQTVTCTHCFNIADHDPCRICEDSGRDRMSLCVVEEPLDVVALEMSGVFNGRYFVLGGVVSPAEGIGPEQLRFAELKERVNHLMEEHTAGDRFEVVIATNPSLEGEATASYIVEVLKESQREKEKLLKISRLAMGLPTGADLEYADRLTLKRSLEGRTEVKGT